MTFTRRQFLVRSGWLAGGITVLGIAGCAALPPLPTFRVTAEKDIFTWVQIMKNGRIRFYLPRAELGQGISTGLSQVVAEELNVALENVDCHYQSTVLMAPCQMTVGSQSMENYFTLTARSAAFLRATLQARAASKYGLTESQLSSARHGFVTHDGRAIQYNELVDEPQVIQLASDTGIPLFSERKAAELTSVGKSVEQVNILSVVTGAEIFSRDVHLDDMHYGAIARAPQLGVKLKRYDRAGALSVAGVIEVVEHEEQVGVVASTPMAAATGIELLNCQWSQLNKEQLKKVQKPLDIDEFIEKKKIDHTVANVGSSTIKPLTYRYDSPMVAHAAMEPRSGVAYYKTREEGHSVCVIWTGCQDPWLVRTAAAKAVGIKKSRVEVHNLRVGGAFGGRVLCQASVEAAWLSKAVGKPVKVQWSREDEFRYNYVGPQFSTRIDANIDKTGQITHWHYQSVGAPILTSSMLVPSYLHWAADLIPDPGTKRGMTIPYDIKNQRVEFADERLPMATGPWRGLGAAPNTFALECAMDELAHTAGKDPIAFRLAHTKNARFTECLRRLQVHLNESTDSVGIAAAIYKENTYVATAVKVDITKGTPRVTKVICVHDCGRVISPDQVRAQIEGNIVWGIGMALHEQFVLENGIAKTTNFDRYQLPTQMDVPDMVVELVESTMSPSGAGEAAIAPAAAAIANGLFAATGRRERQLPIVMG